MKRILFILLFVATAAWAGDKSLIISDSKPIYRRSSVGTTWVRDNETGEQKRLTEQGREQEAMLSPDGKMVAFVRDNNLFYVDLATMTEHRVTTDGEKNRIINGHTDWVYEEEFEFTRAFAFSPDSQQLAWLRFDETEVPQTTMMLFSGRLNPEPYTFKYPRAGEQNSAVEVHVHDIKSGARKRVDTTGEYVPHFGWTPAGELYFFQENRLQNHFRVVVEGRGVVWEERDERYIERPKPETVTFLPDGRMVVMSERGGWRHLWLVGARGKISAVTSGEWEVTELVGVVGERVYYLSNEGSPLRNNMWSVRLDGREKRRLTTEEGIYSITLSEDRKTFTSRFSNATTPLKVCLHDITNGRVLQTLEERIAPPDAIIKEFITINGLNAWILKPKHFNEEEKHPVLMYQYSGPGSQEVLDRWGMDWYNDLVKRGYVVVCVDGRGTGGRGAEFRKCTYGRLGALETEDQIAAARYLAAQTWVDPARIGIYGWSFGGFMALNCMLKGNDVFAAGIAVAPVSSWRFYDTIYTEIYNGLPAENPTGYDDNSPLNHAEKLKGKLFIIHGTADDNVHIQNTYLMTEALTRAGKRFDERIYIDANHSMLPHDTRNVRAMMTEWVLTNL